MIFITYNLNGISMKYDLPIASDCSFETLTLFI